MSWHRTWLVSTRRIGLRAALALARRQRPPQALGQWLPPALGQWLPQALGQWLPQALGQWLPQALGQWLPQALGQWLPLARCQLRLSGLQVRVRLPLIPVRVPRCQPQLAVTWRLRLPALRAVAWR
jgi:hypothetical protein